VLLVEDDDGEVELLDQLARALARAESRGGDVGRAGRRLRGPRLALMRHWSPPAIERLVRRARPIGSRGRVRGGDVLARLDATRFAVVVEGCGSRASSRRSRRVSVT
jgi:hypothetical protein